MALKNIQKDYENYADVYEEKWQGFLSPARSWVLKRIKAHTPAPAKIIDLGCGTGAFLKTLATQYPKADLTGIDGSPAMIDQARGLCHGDPNVKIYTENLEGFGAFKASYDVVICMFVFHHIIEQPAFLENLMNATKSGGRIYFADYAVDGWPMKIGEAYWRLFLKSHHRAYSSAAMRDILNAQTQVKITARKVISSDLFWRVQMYELKKL